mmetsp:Transcript_38603/g.70800  ORF Transcript_38603/g.70800 Transcript_38603/m.70800 type:complete len:119 (-) Transcript_38603:1078-1434(-)
MLLASPLVAPKLISTARLRLAFVLACLILRFSTVLRMAPPSLLSSMPNVSPMASSPYSPDSAENARLSACFMLHHLCLLFQPTDAPSSTTFLSGQIGLWQRLDNLGLIRLLPLPKLDP